MNIDNLLKWGTFTILVIFFLPLLWLGQDAFVTIHDNLDSDYLYLRLLDISHTAFDFNSTIFNVMNGLPRSAMRSGINLEVLSFVVFEPFTAYTINYLLIHLIGFAGMYLLLKKHFLPNPNQQVIVWGTALAFSVVSTYMVHGISSLGQPLYFYAILNFRKNKFRLSDWLIVVLFPIYSFLVWAGFFSVICAGIILIYDWINLKKLNQALLAAILSTGLVYSLVEFQLIYSFFSKAYTSHRTEFNYDLLMPLKSGICFRETFISFIKTYYHAGEFFTIFIFIIALISLAADKKFHQKRKIISLLLTILGICLFHGFYRFFVQGLASVTELPKAFQFDRFYFLLPMIWYLLFAISLDTVLRWKNGFLLTILAIFIQLSITLNSNREFLVNLDKMFGNPLSLPKEKTISYRAFYAENQFGAIRDFIAIPQADYRVICVGFHPAIAQYNGFYTLDSYQNNYLLGYKHQFRKIIENELAVDKKMKEYFDAWGCRAYAFSHEIRADILYHKTSKAAINNSRLNIEAFKQMNGKYVLSSVPINNAGEIGLVQEKVFDDKDSFWKIYLYSTTTKN